MVYTDTTETHTQWVPLPAPGSGRVVGAFSRRSQPRRVRRSDFMGRRDTDYLVFLYKLLTGLESGSG